MVKLRTVNGQMSGDYDVYIGGKIARGCWHLPQSKWHNTFTMQYCGSREQALRDYRRYIEQTPELMAALPELGGKRLGCLCVSDDFCHGHVLVQLYAKHVLSKE